MGEACFDEAGLLRLHQGLAHYNQHRLSPRLPANSWREDIADETAWHLAEGEWVERERMAIAGEAARAPCDAGSFLVWFEDLRRRGPGQDDALFPYLAEQASADEMRWFVEQEMAGEAGFDDLVALTQLKLPTRAKLELARNYWDEMGRGNAAGMHGPMLERIGKAVGARPSIETTVWESLALANTMVALAAHRRYAYHSVGALGAIEMTAPGRVVLVDRGLARLGVAARVRQYYKIHATLDQKHSAAWNREAISTLVDIDPAAAPAIAEGALLRLTCGARCYQRYRKHFGFDTPVRGSPARDPAPPHGGLRAKRDVRVASGSH